MTARAGLYPPRRTLEPSRSLIAQSFDPARTGGALSCTSTTCEPRRTEAADGRERRGASARAGFRSSPSRPSSVRELEQDAAETVGPPGADPLDAATSAGPSQYRPRRRLGRRPPSRSTTGCAARKPEETYMDIGALAGRDSLDAGPAPRLDRLEAVDEGIDGGAASAEEAAVHLIDPGGAIDEPGSDERWCPVEGRGGLAASAMWSASRPARREALAATGRGHLRTARWAIERAGHR